MRQVISKIYANDILSIYSKSTQLVTMILPAKKYFGKANIERSLNNYFLSVSRHSIEEEIPNHHHENPYLSLNIGAAYLESNKFTEEIIESGKIILRTADYEHQNKFQFEYGLCFNIEVTTKFSKELLELFAHTQLHCSGIDIFKILVMSISGYENDELDCYITETLLSSHDNEHPFRAPKWYRNIISKIQEDYNTPISLSVLAELTNLHPNYLARKFKQIKGMTIGEYIRMVRVQKASIEIASTKRLTDIAFESGFYDQPHFSNAFRSTFNITPSNLRSALLGTKTK